MPLFTTYEQQREYEDAMFFDSLPQGVRDRENELAEVRWVGAEREDQAWILSDRDVWYPNPYYKGPPVKHPEMEDY
jgi:hypothetical protein